MASDLHLGDAFYYLSWNTGNCDRSLLWFSSVPLGACRDRILNFAMIDPYHIPSNSLLTIIQSFENRHLK